MRLDLHGMEGKNPNYYMKTLLLSLLLVLGAPSAVAQTYSVTGPVSVKAGGPFKVSWTVTGMALRTRDTIAMCDSAGRWISYAPTGGLASGTMTFTAAPIPVLTIKYFRTGTLGGSLISTPTAVTYIYVIPYPLTPTAAYELH